MHYLCSMDSPLLWLRVDPEIEYLAEIRFHQPAQMWVSRYFYFTRTFYDATYHSNDLAQCVSFRSSNGISIVYITVAA